jgi:hypothetical protein
MSPASCRFRRLGPRLAGAAFLLTSLAVAAGASPAAPGPRTHPVGGPPACAAGAIDDLLVGDGIDFGRRGFELRRLGEGYALEALEALSEGACGEHGEVLDQALTAATTWRHGASGSSLFVRQRQAPEPVANLLEPGWATFWWQGYAFQLSVGWGCADPPTGGVAERWAFGRPAAFEPPPRTGSPYEAVRRALPRAPWALPKSPPLPCGPPDGDLLVPAIAALAPGLDLACFHRRHEGAWDDLGALGLGDPRPELPSSYAESYFQLSYLEPPAAGCGGPAPEGGAGVSLSAFFAAADGAWAAVAAYSLQPGWPPSQGFIDDYGASWSDERYQYSAAAWSADGTGDRELVLALAAALDSGFSEACMVAARQLTPAEAVALGFHLAQPPAGFTESWSQLTAQAASPACADPPPPTYAFYWTFTDGGDLGIGASLHRDGAGGGGGGVGVAPPGGGGADWLAWTDAQGTSYTVYGFSNSGGPGPAEELLVAVARSMDPSFGGL